MKTSRRSFLTMAAGVVAAPLSSRLVAAEAVPAFKISLAQWSLHKALFAKQMKNTDFPVMAKKDFGIDGVEWVNQFWKDKATDAAYVAELKKICEGEGVTSVLIMCDGEGHLGDPDDAARGKAVDNHKKWIEAAKALGCHSIRVNAHTAGKGTRDEQAKRAVDGLRRLSEVAAPYQIGVIVENHGQLSSDGGWLAGVMKDVGLKNCGTLPDFGNFRLDGNAEYDRYKGVDELMPYAKGVSAKSHDFNEAGEETHTDYHKMLDIVVKKHGWHGFVGIEYEGSKLGEVEGIKATKALLEKVRGTLKA
ncbi:MAG: Sugar phosphate isomerase/epimerase [Verrucomicrobia bacterium]|jgi:sugar phosphate isomerase/epimerase|nr:MAG: Sugar phosphate isomerase/epimerase [Verrucomicrobiota bacterium]